MPYVALLYFFALFNGLKICTSQPTALAVNKAITSSHDDTLPISTEAGDFRSLAANSQVFVDRSLLLLDVLQTSTRILLITAPTKWGKTVLLHMIKDFVELEVDARGKKRPYKDCFGYNMFKRGFFSNESFIVDLEKTLLIFNHQPTFNKFQAKFPVIFIDFSHLSATNAEGFVNSVKQIIMEIFNRYGFLEKFYEKNMNTVKRSETQRMEAGIMYKKYVKIAKGEVEIPELEQSLAFLCEALNRYLYKEIIVCIDGYDTPINDILMMKNYYDRKRSLEFYDRLLMTTLHNNYFIWKAFLSGAVRYANRPYLTFARHINFLDDKYAHFFSFSQTDVDSMLNYFKISKDKSLVEYWYGGHRARASTFTTYNPWSIVNFLESYKIEPYLLKHFFANESLPDELEDALCILISNNEYVIHVGKNDPSLFFDHELDRIFHKEEPCKKDIFVHLLLFHGYLTVGNFSLSDNKTIPLRIPNYEGIQYWKSHLKQKWISKFQLPAETDLMEYFQPLAYLLKNISLMEYTKIREFQDTVEKYVLEMPTVQSKKSFSGYTGLSIWLKFIKSIIRSMFNLVAMMFENVEKLNLRFPSMSSLNPDAILVFEDRLIVVEIKGNEKFRNASDRAVVYRDYFRNFTPCVKTIRFLGIQIIDNRGIKISQGYQTILQ